MDRQELDRAKRDREWLIQEMKNAGAQTSRDGRRISCPFHDDKTPSSGVYQRVDGSWAFKCQSVLSGCGFGGDVFDVIARSTGKSVDEVLLEFTSGQRKVQSPAVSVPHKKERKIYATMADLRRVVDFSDGEDGGKISDEYTYTNPVTKKPDLIVFKLMRPNGKKTFRQACAIEGGFTMSAPDGRLPLFNRTRIATANEVVVVEGEKCVKALAEYGIVATTNPGGAGAGKVVLTDWTPLAGKRVYLWWDWDPKNPPLDKEGRPNPKAGLRTGEEHMKEVAAELQKLEPPCDLYWMRVADLDLPDKGDAANYIERLSVGTNDREGISLALQAAILDADPMGLAGEVISQVEEAIAGLRYPIPLPWDLLSRATKMLLPGTVSVICGTEGAAKTFGLLQILANSYDRGESVAGLFLEEDRPYYLRRCVAQRAGKGKYTDDEWCKANPDEARKIGFEHTEFMNGFGRCIYSFETGEIKPDALIEWVRARAAAGCKLIAIDPITAMDAGDRQWVADLKFLTAVKRIARDFKARILLVSHPKNGTKSGKGTMNEIAGGTAYRRFSACIIWLDHLESPAEGPVKVSTGVIDAIWNRIFRILKARNSFGAGYHIAFWFNPETFRFEERGVMPPKKKGAEAA